MMGHLFKPNTKKVRQILVAIKGLGGSIAGYFLAIGKPNESALTGLIIGAIDFIVPIFSDGTNEILKQNFETNGTENN
jgi:hypothetical protein